jgi:hypothetical protein
LGREVYVIPIPLTHVAGTGIDTHLVACASLESVNVIKIRISVATEKTLCPCEREADIFMRADAGPGLMLQAGAIN